MRIDGYVWDRINREKVELHGLEPDEVEDLFEDGSPYFIPNPPPENRHIALGFLPDSRFALVVFEYDASIRFVRVVTAYEPTSEKWWRTYAQEKGFTP